MDWVGCGKFLQMIVNVFKALDSGTLVVCCSQMDREHVLDMKMVVYISIWDLKSVIMFWQVIVSVTQLLVSHRETLYFTSLCAMW